MIPAVRNAPQDPMPRRHAPERSVLAVTSEDLDRSPDQAHTRTSIAMASTLPIRAATTARVVDYETRHKEAFRALNLEWITTYFTLEEADRKLLDDPEGAVLRPGGCILMAEEGEEIVGTCALVRIAADAFELAKMAVKPAVRGKGIGALLGRAAVERAIRMGARRVELLSNAVLQPALHLYRKLGFVEVSLASSDYQRADIKMVLDLETTLKCVLIVADDLSTGLAANAAAVLGMAVGSQAPCLTGPDVVDGAGRAHPGLTWITLPVLRASRQQIEAIVRGARAGEPLTVVDLPEVAQRARTYDDYTRRLAETPAEELSYAGLALFGPREIVTALTGALPLLQ
jgi:GNAT superfamily N-acetyltransferase